MNPQHEQIDPFLAFSLASGCIVCGHEDDVSEVPEATEVASARSRPHSWQNLRREGMETQFALGFEGALR